MKIKFVWRNVRHKKKKQKQMIIANCKKKNKTTTLNYTVRSSMECEPF